MTEQERPRTLPTTMPEYVKALRAAYKDGRTEGRQQAVREIQDAVEDGDLEGIVPRFYAVVGRIRAGLSELPPHHEHSRVRNVCLDCGVVVDDESPTPGPHPFEEAVPHGLACRICMEEPVHENHRGYRTADRVGDASESPHFHGHFDKDGCTDDHGDASESPPTVDEVVYEEGGEQVVIRRRVGDASESPPTCDLCGVGYPEHRSIHHGVGTMSEPRYVYDDGCCPHGRLHVCPPQRAGRAVQDDGLSHYSTDQLVAEIKRRNVPADDEAVARLLEGLSESAILDFVDWGAVTAEQARRYLRAAPLLHDPQHDQPDDDAVPGSVILNDVRRRVQR